MKNTSSAVSELAEVVGRQSLFQDRTLLANYKSDNGITRGRIPDVVVKPSSTNQVSEIVKIANKYRMPVVTCSSGVHFGGFSLPLVGGIVVDLGGMSRILEVDARNRMVRFEPGVRYAGLQDTLATSNLMALNPLLPHRKKSVLSSHLQREPMIIPKFEYGDDVLTMEVVLPQGQIFRTGSAAAPGSPDNTLSDLVSPYGPGLDFFRLFLGAQGTLGIVTWMSTKIEYLPHIQKFFMISFDDISDLIGPVYEIQRKMLGNECFVLNRHNLALISSESGVEVKSIEKKLPLWTLFICLAGGPKRPEEKIEYEERALRSLEKEFHLSVLASGNHPVASKVETLIRRPWPNGELFWKHRDKGGSYELKTRTTLDRVPEVLSIINSYLSGTEYSSPGHYVQVLERARACYCETSIFYEPTSSRDKRELRTIIRAMTKELLLKGVLFIEPDDVISDVVFRINPTYTSVLRSVKHLLDPNEIMNPGHLCF